MGRAESEGVGCKDVAAQNPSPEFQSRPNSLSAKERFQSWVAVCQLHCIFSEFIVRYCASFPSRYSELSYN